MFRTQSPVAPSNGFDDASSIKNGKTRGNSFSRFFQRKDQNDPFASNYNSHASISSVNTYSTKPNTSGQVNGNDPNYLTHHARGGSVSAPVTTMQFNSHRPSHEIPRSGMGTLSEELQNYQQYQQHLQTFQDQDDHQVELQYPTPGMEGYRQCLQWLQQTCRPVFMKELSHISNVPVPITAANAKNASQIGGTRDVQIATWKDCSVQIVPMERWGSPQEVLAECIADHVIQLYGYLPNANVASGQSPALLMQQPSCGSLRQFLSHNMEAIQWPDRYKLALDIAQGLRFLTEQGVPCTLNSGNILVDHEGVALLTGFGSPGGMITSTPSQMTSQPSGPSLVVYMAPERIMGMGNYTLEWSVYSLGVLLWELSSGRMPFEEIITRAESGTRLTKSMEQLSSAIVKGLREEAAPNTPEIYEQLYKMCWSGDVETRPPLDVVEETLQMLVVVEPMDMLMLPGEEMNMTISAVVSESIDGDAISAHSLTRSNSVRSASPVPSHGHSSSRSKPVTLHESISMGNADMTEWYILAGHDLNGYAIVPTFSLECEITPIQTCLGHYMPASVVIFKELMEQDVDVKLLAKRSLQNCLHILLDRYIPFKNEKGSSHLFVALDMLLAAGVEVNALDIQGNTPLHLLMRNPKISSDDVAECLRRMVAKGADTSIHTPKDGNVLTLAAKYLHFEAARYILNTDVLASEPDSIDRAIEACMTMTGRATDTFVNLRGKTRELLKLWTGKAGAPRREKLVLRVMQEAGQLDQTGIRITKGKPRVVAPQPQMDCANVFYDKYVKKKRERLLSTVGALPGGVYR
ncbi:hypothetical protein BGZ99_001528 [Dissophora globulifera]|uniref:Protein kinase domain-containing protein n=1 Tax=Dissophora globulifera TaxID=979702 RepID=A0A9P6RU59_9FUNG|nr:hypothetical protein BGZ99_001528 [Dissophora globulifera]